MRRKNSRKGSTYDKIWAKISQCSVKHKYCINTYQNSAIVRYFVQMLMLYYSTLISLRLNRAVHFMYASYCTPFWQNLVCSKLIHTPPITHHSQYLIWNSSMLVA